jgi:PAS domain S-box-containing protein
VSDSESVAVLYSPTLDLLVHAIAAAPDGALIERAGIVMALSPILIQRVGALHATTLIGHPTPSGLAPIVGDEFQVDGVGCRVCYCEHDPGGRDMFRALFESTAAVKLLIDPVDGAIVNANLAAQRFYGWSLAELQAMTIHEINLLTPTEIADEMERARTRRRQCFWFRHRVRSGAVTDVEVYSGPIELNGKCLLLSIVHDVTERRRIEEALRQAQRLEALGRLAAGIAHDFNNLLTVIQTSAQLIIRRGAADTVSAVVIDISMAARRGAELTRRLLALGRQQSLSPSAVDLGAMLAETTVLLRRTLPESIIVTSSATDGLSLVMIDRGQLELVLLNLALNARDAMPNGGHLELAVSRAAATPPELLPGEYLAITVTDSGTGMDEDTRRRAFEPFFTTKSSGVGSGLGLPVALGVVAQSGGTMTLDSRPGGGTCFTLFVPIAHHPG